MTVHAASSPRTEQILSHRHDLPAGHPDRAVLRARVIEAHLPMATNLARRYGGRGEMLEDLAQVAALALVRAVDGYDPTRQTPFARYAVPCILGALKRHFRDTAWGMRVPRAAQELVREMATTADELSQQRGRPPTPAEIADRLQVSIGDLRNAVGASQVYRLASLDAPHAGVDRTAVIDTIGAVDTHYAAVDDHLALRPLLAALPLRERRIIAMRYFRHMSQSLIADEIGLSQMHVSRLLKQSLARLRADMPT